MVWILKKIGNDLFARAIFGIACGVILIRSGTRRSPGSAFTSLLPLTVRMDQHSAIASLRADLAYKFSPSDLALNSSLLHVSTLCFTKRAWNQDFKNTTVRDLEIHSLVRRRCLLPLNTCQSPTDTSKCYSPSKLISCNLP